MLVHSGRCSQKKDLSQHCYGEATTIPTYTGAQERSHIRKSPGKSATVRESTNRNRKCCVLLNLPNCSWAGTAGRCCWQEAEDWTESGLLCHWLFPYLPEVHTTIWVITAQNSWGGHCSLSFHLQERGPHPIHHQWSFAKEGTDERVTDPPLSCNYSQINDRHGTHTATLEIAGAVLDVSCLMWPLGMFLLIQRATVYDLGSYSASWSLHLLLKYLSANKSCYICQCQYSLFMFYRVVSLILVCLMRITERYTGRVSEGEASHRVRPRAGLKLPVAVAEVALH